METVNGQTFVIQRKDERKRSMEKRLYKSSTNKIIDGVCADIAEYFNVDPTLVRLGAVILGCMGGGVLVYIVAAIIIPRNPN